MPLRVGSAFENLHQSFCRRARGNGRVPWCGHRRRCSNGSCAGVTPLVASGDIDALGACSPVLSCRLILVSHAIAWFSDQRSVGQMAHNRQHAYVVFKAIQGPIVRECPAGLLAQRR